MLRKLLKYDLGNIFKFLSIFYALSLIFSVLTRVFLNIENSMVAFVIGEIFRGAAISMMFSIIINNLMRFWVRFRQNLYGDEAYLTHTLPVEKRTVYLSKFITALITMLSSIIVIALSLVIIFYKKELFDILKSAAQSLESSLSVIILALLLVLFLEFVNILQIGLTGIILGHKRNNAKIGSSVLFGFISYGITQLFVLLCLFAIALFSTEFMNMFISSSMPSAKTLKLVVALSIVLYSFIAAAVCFINIKILKKGVNVD